MEPKFVHTATEYVEVQVNKTKTADYAYRIANGIPLPVNPYFMAFFNSNGPNKGRMLTIQYYDNCGQPTAVTTSSYAAGLMTGPSDTDCNIMIGELDRVVSDMQGWQANVLLSKIKAQSLPLLMLYKERHQTGKLITKFFDDALFCIGNLKHPKRVLFRMGVYDPQKHTGNFLRRLRKKTMSCSTAGDAWLQYRFAWTPLYHDIVDSVNAAADFERKLHKFSQRSGRQFGTSIEKNMRSVVDGERVWSGKIQGVVSYKVNYYISDATLAGVGSMMDIPTFLWDTVPWSFVIDRVVDVSRYLDLRNATLGTQFTSGYSTTFFRRTIIPAAIDIMYWPNRFTYKFGGQKYVQQYLNPPPREDVYMNRVKLTSFPTPTLEYPLSFTITHGVDYVALGHQLVERMRKKPRL